MTYFTKLYFSIYNADMFLFCFVLPAVSSETAHPVLPSKFVSDFTCFFETGFKFFKTHLLCRMKQPAESRQMGSAR